MIVHVKVNKSTNFQQLNPICVTVSSEKVLKLIIRTVVRIVGMGRMSHICNTKCSRL